MTERARRFLRARLGRGLARVRASAHDDDRLRDTEGRLSHSEGDSACVERR